MTSIVFIEGGGPVSVSYTDFDGSASSSSHSVSISAGAAAPDRLLACALHFFGAQSTSPVLSSAAFHDGVLSIPAITPYVQTFQAGGTLTGGDIGSAFVWAYVPGGNPVTLNLTFSTAVALNVGTFRLIGAQSVTPIDTASLPFVVSSGTATTNIDTLASGALLACMTGFHSVSMGITAGVTEDYNTNIIPGNDTWRAGGHHMTATETNRAVTVSKGGGSAMRGAIAAVSFR